MCACGSVPNATPISPPPFSSSWAALHPHLAPTAAQCNVRLAWCIDPALTQSHLHWPLPPAPPAPTPNQHNPKPQEGIILTCSSSLARQLLASPAAPVLEALGAGLQFEVAVGLNGRVWVCASTPATTVLVSNAILESEFKTKAQVRLWCWGVGGGLGKARVGWERKGAALMGGGHTRGTGARGKVGASSSSHVGKVGDRAGRGKAGKPDCCTAAAVAVSWLLCGAQPATPTHACGTWDPQDNLRSCAARLYRWLQVQTMVSRILAHVQ